MDPLLQPCPFCAAVPETACAQPDAGFYVCCDNPACPVWLVETRSYNTAEQAAAAWNTRTPAPAVAS